jgi:hypothetical protein
MRRGIAIAILVMIFQLVVSQKCWSGYTVHSVIIEGVSRKDAQEAMKDIVIILHQKKFAKFRTLISLKGKRIKPIGLEDFLSSIKDVQLTDDDKVLLNLIVCAINSKNIYLLEFEDDAAHISAAAEKIVKRIPKGSVENLPPGIKVIWENLPDSQKNKDVNKGVLLSYANDNGGGITGKTSNGSYSLIVNNYKETTLDKSDYLNSDFDTVFNPAGRPAITGHELLGHGLSCTMRMDYLKHADSDPIRIENLILRVMGFKVQRTGKFHNKENIEVPDFSKLPDSCEEMMKQHSPQGMRD